MRQNQGVGGVVIFDASVSNLTAPIFVQERQKAVSLLLKMAESMSKE